jgi:predicted MFS family arabinose efflux permease
LVKDVFHGGAGRFSTLLVAFGAGGLLGAAGLLSISPTINPQRLVSGLALVQAAALLLTGLAPGFWALPPLLMLAGASMTAGNTAANSLLQAGALPHLLGQTVSLYMLAVRGGIAIGALLMGAAVSLVGVQHALLISGLAALVIQAALARTWARAQ